MANPNEHLVDWLRDAYAMEKQAESMLKAQSSRLENYPELRQRIDQHLQETWDSRPCSKVASAASAAAPLR